MNNNYGESDLKFIVSSRERYKYHKIISSIIYKNNTMSYDTNEFVYVYNETIKDINYYVFQFEFKNDIIKNILIILWYSGRCIPSDIFTSNVFYW